MLDIHVNGQLVLSKHKYNLNLMYQQFYYCLYIHVLLTAQKYLTTSFILIGNLDNSELIWPYNMESQTIPVYNDTRPLFYISPWAVY